MKECAKEFIEFLKSRGFEIRVKEEEKTIIVGFISTIDEEKKVFLTIVFDEEDYRILVQGAKFLPKIKEERKPLIYEAINIANDTGLNYKYTTTEDEIFIEGYYLIRILDNFNINILSRIMIEMQDRIKSDYEIFTKVMN